MNGIEKLRINSKLSMIAYAIYGIITLFSIHRIGRFANTYIIMSALLCIIFLSSKKDLVKYMEFLHEERSHKNKRNTRNEKLYLSRYLIGSFALIIIYCIMYIIILNKYLRFYSIINIVITMLATALTSALFAFVVQAVQRCFEILIMEEKSWEE